LEIWCACADDFGSWSPSGGETPAAIPFQIQKASSWQHLQHRRAQRQRNQVQPYRTHPQQVYRSASSTSSGGGISFDDYTSSTGCLPVHIPISKGCGFPLGYLHIMEQQQAWCLDHGFASCSCSITSEHYIYSNGWGAGSGSSSSSRLSPQADVSLANYLDSTYYSDPEDMHASLQLLQFSPTPPITYLTLPAFPTLVSHQTLLEPVSSNTIDISSQIQENSYPNLAPRPNSAPPAEPTLPMRSSSKRACWRCGNRLSNARNRRRHEDYSCPKLNHKKVTNCSFGKCRQPFHRPDALTKHMTQVHKACNMCSDVFETKREVTEHKQNVHHIPKRTSSGSDAPIAF
jgi:hypothetical protein